MVEKQEYWSVREKKELVAKEEKTIPGRCYIPYTPTSTRLMTRSRSFWKCPASKKKDLNVALENDVLRVAGQIDSFPNTRTWSRSIPSTTSAITRGSFTLSNKVDQEKDQRQPRGRRVDAHPAKGGSTPSRGRSRSVERRRRGSGATMGKRFAASLRRIERKMERRPLSAAVPRAHKTHVGKVAGIGDPRRPLDVDNGRNAQISLKKPSSIPSDGGSLRCFGEGLFGRRLPGGQPGAMRPAFPEAYSPVSSGRGA